MHELYSPRLLLEQQGAGHWRRPAADYRFRRLVIRYARTWCSRANADFPGSSWISGWALALRRGPGDSFWIHAAADLLRRQARRVT